MATSSPIGGTLPAYLGYFPRLSWLTFGSCGMTGTIPSTYFTLWPYMFNFDVSRTCFTKGRG